MFSTWIGNDKSWPVAEPTLWDVGHLTLMNFMLKYFLLIFKYKKHENIAIFSLLTHTIYGNNENFTHLDVWSGSATGPD